MANDARTCPVCGRPFQSPPQAAEHKRFDRDECRVAWHEVARRIGAKALRRASETTLARLFREHRIAARAAGGET